MKVRKATMKMRKTIVTPAMAREYLKSLMPAVEQRLSNRRANRFTIRMMDGEWIPMTSNLGLNSQGMMTDGPNRRFSCSVQNFLP